MNNYKEHIVIIGIPFSKNGIKHLQCFSKDFHPKDMEDPYSTIAKGGTARGDMFLVNQPFCNKAPITNRIASVPKNTSIEQALPKDIRQFELVDLRFITGDYSKDEVRELMEKSGWIYSHEKIDK